MEPRSPRHMSNDERLRYALNLLDEAFNALCWIGTGTFGVSVPSRPPRVAKAINRIDKTMTALEKEAGLR